MNRVIALSLLSILLWSSCCWFCKKTKLAKTDQNTLILNDSLSTFEKNILYRNITAVKEKNISSLFSISNKYT